MAEAPEVTTPKVASLSISDLATMPASTVELSTTTGSIGSKADPAVVELLTTPLFAPAVSMAHDNVNSGQFVRIQQLLPLATIGPNNSQKFLRSKLVVALKTSRQARDEQSDDKVGSWNWIVKTDDPKSTDNGYAEAEQAGTLNQYGVLTIRATTRDTDK